MYKTYSCYYYPLEYIKPHVHIEYNNNKVNLNEAEAKALQQIENRNRRTELKKLKQKEYNKKYNKSALLYEEEQRMKNREEQILKKKEQDEQILRIQNYNKTVYQNNMKPFLKEKEKLQTLNKEHIKTKKKKLLKKSTPNKLKKEKENKSSDKKKSIEIKDNEDIETKEILDNLVENDFKNKANNDSNLLNKNNLNLNKKKDLTNSNKDVVDLRIHLENQVLEEIKQKNLLLANNEVLDQVDDKISTIKKFRTFGLLPEDTTIKNKSKKKDIKNKKANSEYERRRFAKAINNVITEKLGEKNISLQNICNCGNLVKKINDMIENDNINILNDIECEKNCIFYNDKNSFLERINEVLSSVKELHFDNNKKLE